uniref:Growth factor receptor domain-containing protein n=1 Tax=Salvator merianae TaxID=96440 RepID=A0A8D0E0M8_SALMN
MTFLFTDTTCVDICPDGYYRDTDENHCHVCHRSCKTCYGKHSTQCLSCSPGWYKQEDRCVQICETGYYANNVTYSCGRCHKTCKECLGPESTDCLTCDNGFFLLESKNECHASCPELYYADNDKHACERCHPTCLSCTVRSKVIAISCVSNFKEDPERCEKCHDSCLECKGPGPLNCTECHLNMNLYRDENRCVPCCKTSEEETLQECCDCSEMHGKNEQKGLGEHFCTVAFPLAFERAKSPF